MREDINNISRRLDEAEEGIDSEEMLMERAKCHSHSELKLMALEEHSHCSEIRIYGVVEGAKAGSPSVIHFIKTLLEEGLSLPSWTSLGIRRAHCALAATPPAEAPTRPFMAKFASSRMKDILKKSQFESGFDFQPKRIYLDND